MKTAVILLLTLAATVSAKAQQPTLTPQHGAGEAGRLEVTVVKFGWRKERLPGWETNPFGQSFETYEARRQRLDNERRMQHARNTGNKPEQFKREAVAKTIEDATAPKNAKKEERPRDGYRYTMVVKNAGAKVIKQIDWDYVFLDAQTGAEVARHRFTSEEKVRPGKDKELEVLILAPPVRTVSARDAKGGAQPATHSERVVIMRVEYADGSAWQSP